MSVTCLRLWTRTHCHGRIKLLTVSAKKPFPSSSTRTYSIHHNIDFGNTKSDLLTESVGARKGSEPKHDHVGPFQLGLSQSALRKGEKIKKWSELSTGGKVMRTTARTTNLGVILLGAGLSALLIYSLTSELLSKNSPTVLYGDACERIKQSSKIAKYLNAPLTFHNNPPSSVRPRHRNRHVTSKVMVDTHGQEHMIMTFYVQGRPEGEAPPSDDSYLQILSTWFQGKTADLSDLSFDEAVEWSKESTQNIWDKSVRAFKYLSGAPLPPPPLPPLPTSEKQEIAKKQESSAWRFAGIFSSLRSPKGPTAESPARQMDRHFTEGEVHADLVKNQDGYFVFRYLLVDIPSSRDYNPVRIFVERQPGVGDNVPIMRWIS